ncbi:MAG: hypothetical protein QM786_05455 [Breznakibacter sp.]
MKRVFFFLTCWVVVYMGFSQTMVISDIHTLSDQFNFERSKNVTFDGSSYRNVTGSPYLNDAFIAGEVVVNDSARIEKNPFALQYLY